MITELIGYFASALVILSLMMKNIFTLRLINTVAAIWFVIYGFLIQSYPVILTNALIVLINFYHLYNEFRKD